MLHQLGFQSGESDDPYLAMAELIRRPRHYGAVVLSLLSLYREELQIIPAIKKRFPQIEIWLTQTDGRVAAMAEAMRLGADGLLTEDGLHRIAAAPLPEPVSSLTAPLRGLEDGAVSSALLNANRYNDTAEPGEPLLSADELRALLQD